MITGAERIPLASDGINPTIFALAINSNILELNAH